MENVNFEKISFSEVDVIYKVNENYFIKSYQKDAINEGCVFCVFKDDCPVNKKNCFVTFLKTSKVPYYRDLQNGGKLIFN